MKRSANGFLPGPSWRSATKTWQRGVPVVRAAPGNLFD
jgi:hypothetical protein